MFSLKKISKSLVICFYFTMIIISLYYVFLVKSYSYNNIKVSDFCLSSENIVFKQGAVVIYKSQNNNPHFDCCKIKSYILNSEKRIVGKGYCNKKDGTMQINIDTSEYPQGLYYLMTEISGNKAISKYSFNIEILDPEAKTGVN